MPLTPINYSKTIIYRIFCDQCDYVYIGSTTDFVRRKAAHKSNCNNKTKSSYNFKVYETIRENGGWNNFKMLEIEQYPCENSKQARKREQFWIDFYKANLNLYKAFGGETKQEYTKQYYLEHKEEFKQQKAEYYQEHAKELKQQTKQYRIEHKEEIKQKKAEYYLEHKEEFKQQHLKYYQEHKEELSQKITCECGAIVSKNSLTRHKKRQIHLEAI